jgi:hypothetical protein
VITLLIYIHMTASVVSGEFLDTNSEVLGTIPGATRFSDSVCGTGST